MGKQVFYHHLMGEGQVFHHLQMEDRFGNPIGFVPPPGAEDRFGNPIGFVPPSGAEDRFGAPSSGENTDTENGSCEANLETPCDNRFNPTSPEWIDNKQPGSHLQVIKQARFHLLAPVLIP